MYLFIRLRTLSLQNLYVHPYINFSTISFSILFEFVAHRQSQLNGFIGKVQRFDESWGGYEVHLEDNSNAFWNGTGAPKAGFELRGVFVRAENLAYHTKKTTAKDVPDINSKSLVSSSWDNVVPPPAPPGSPRKEHQKWDSAQHGLRAARVKTSKGLPGRHPTDVVAGRCVVDNAGRPETKCTTVNESHASRKTSTEPSVRGNRSTISKSIIRQSHVTRLPQAANGASVPIANSRKNETISGAKNTKSVSEAVGSRASVQTSNAQEKYQHRTVFPIQTSKLVTADCSICTKKISPAVDKTSSSASQSHQEKSSGNSGLQQSGSTIATVDACETVQQSNNSDKKSIQLRTQQQSVQKPDALNNDGDQCKSNVRGASKSDGLTTVEVDATDAQIPSKKCAPHVQTSTAEVALTQKTCSQQKHADGTNISKSHKSPRQTGMKSHANKEIVSAELGVSVEQKVTNAGEKPNASTHAIKSGGDSTKASSTSQKMKDAHLAAQDDCKILDMQSPCVKPQQKPDIIGVKALPSPLRAKVTSTPRRSITTKPIRENVADLHHDPISVDGASNRKGHRKSNMAKSDVGAVNSLPKIKDSSPALVVTNSQDVVAVLASGSNERVESVAEASSLVNNKSISQSKVAPPADGRSKARRAVAQLRTSKKKTMVHRDRPESDSGLEVIEDRIGSRRSAIFGQVVRWIVLALCVGVVLHSQYQQHAFEIWESLLSGGRLSTDTPKPRGIYHDVRLWLTGVPAKKRNQSVADIIDRTESKITKMKASLAARRSSSQQS